MAKQLPQPRHIDLIVIHCSATTPKLDVDIKWIDRLHRKRGFFKVGYHFLIKRDGSIEKGRDLDQVGAHAKGYNNNSIGICLSGGVDEDNKPVDNFTDKQYRTLKYLLLEALDLYPSAKIVGHRDLPKVNKDCPCFDVSEMLLSLGFDKESIWRK